MDNDFDSSIEEIRGQLMMLYRRIIQSAREPSAGVNEAYEALSVLVEELYLSDEQIDLNYEEMLETRQKLEEERTNYRELFEFAPDAYLVTDTHGMIKDANRAAAALFNVRQEFLLTKPLTLYVDRKFWNKFVMTGGSALPVNDFEMTIQPRNSDPLVVAVKLTVVYNPQRQPVGYRWLLRNITEQKRAQYAMAASEAHFRTIFQGATLGMVLTDLKQVIMEANPAFAGMLDVEKDSLTGIEISSLSADGNALIAAVDLTMLLKGRREHCHAERLLLRRSGESFWAHLIVSPLYLIERRPQYLLYMVEDVSVARQTAGELAEMKQRLQDSSEAERLSLAQEIHDGPMQDLYGAIFKVATAQNQVGSPGLQENLKSLHEVLEGVTGSLRAICGELRPPALDDFGLETAIRSHAGNLQELFPRMDIRLDLQPEAPALSKETQLALFRMYQQCMTNVLRHAGASQVEVRFALEDSALVLSVSDNGRGFALPESWLEFLRQGRFGLAGIAERVDDLGGKLAVQSHPATGTLIEIRLPRA